MSNQRLDAVDLIAPFHGVRSSLLAITSIEVMCNACSPRMTPEQFFSHTTAGRLWHLPLPRFFSSSEPLRVATPARDSRPRAAGVTAHRLCPPSHRAVVLGRVRVSDAVSTWLQLASILIPGTRSAFVPRVDLAYSEWKVLVEYDGQQHRTDSKRYARDVKRAADLREAGWVLITVLKEGLHGAGQTASVDRIRRALQTAGWRP
ncbi:hypothetical protein B7R25_15045 [Subtercola boreus]|uniref:DUF559 domain-containing protein n=1 Tax=Subtercola boreus TaxID=120213 RepID=A0A3E0W851_9MICO|nr:hypothetical protein B7R24_15015 [Subtercola boreus]RFA18354.1 hypothetical protein B7R23_15050 [Subtercola boreus]RFA24883.1 hypothetical protein B7R25_15045 [Subtercola boreus]